MSKRKIRRRPNAKLNVMPHTASPFMAEAEGRFSQIFEHLKEVYSDRRALDLCIDTSKGMAEQLRQIQIVDLEEE